MLRFSECLAADDVTIRCRVRHSGKASQREFTEPQEMLCTMRVWHKTNTPSASNVIRNIGMTETRSFESPPMKPKCDDHGPELLLTRTDAPVTVHTSCSGDFAGPITMSHRFASFGSGSADKIGRRSAGRSPSQRSSPLVTPTALSDTTMPVSDIMVVDMFGQGSLHQCNITTLSCGYFEFTMENRNGQDVLLAFLKASLPKDRVMESIHHRTGSELSSRTGHSEWSGKSFDVEAFTAKRMSERLQRETISEKLRRKVVRVFSSIEEISVAFTDCVCGCSNGSISPAPLSEIERRDSPPPSLQYEYDLSEPSATPDQTQSRLRRTSRTPEETIKRQQILKDCNLPSGLSVEVEDGSERETTIS